MTMSIISCKVFAPCSFFSRSMPLESFMTSGVYFSSVGYIWHLCATFSLFFRPWNVFSGYFTSRGLCPLSPLPLVFIFISGIRLTLIMCILQPFSPSLERFFQANFTLLFASFQFFSILQVLVRGECGVCLHSAKLLLLFVLFRFPPSCGGAVGGTLSGVHDQTNNA